MRWPFKCVASIIGRSGIPAFPCTRSYIPIFIHRENLAKMHKDRGLFEPIAHEISVNSDFSLYFPLETRKDT